MKKLSETFYLLFVVLSFFLAVSLIKLAFASDVAQRSLKDTTVLVLGLECSGSGSVVQASSGKNYILTNNHVCNCSRYKGTINGSFEGGELIQGAVVKRDWRSDLCAALISKRQAALHLAPSLPPQSEVETRGYPHERLAESHGRVGRDETWEYTMPISEVGECPPPSEPVRSYTGNLVACRMQFTSTLSNLYSRPGSSGSPVVDLLGRLVGVISSFHPTNMYDAGLVTFEDVKKFLRGL